MAAAGTSGIFMSASRACDHGPAPGFVRGQGFESQWGYGGVVAPTDRFGVLPDYDRCPVCQPRLVVPPPCPPPPCGEEYAAVGVYQRTTYREYRRTEFATGYPLPTAPYPSPQAAPAYAAPYPPFSPPGLSSKQAPGVYGSPQFPEPASVSPPPYAAPQARGLYGPQSPPAGYGQVPPHPTPYSGPQQ